MMVLGREFVAVVVVRPLWNAMFANRRIWIFDFGFRILD